MAKEERKNKKNKRNFLKEFKSELKKVIWPTSKQLVNNTIAVLTIVLITTLVVFVLDLAFAGLNTYGIDKLKTKQNTTQTEIVEENENIQVNEETSDEVTDEVIEEVTEE